MPRTTVAMRSRRSPVRGFFVRRMLAVVLIAAGTVLVGVAAYDRIDGLLAQKNARSPEPPPSSDEVSPPEVTVEGPDGDGTPLVDMSALDVEHFDETDHDEAISEADPGGVLLSETADFRDLAPSHVELSPAADSLTSLRVVIPRLGMDLAVFEGVSAKALRRGPGHLPGTPCPGLSRAEGNCVLTGHRDSFFRPLSNAREGDLVELRAGDRSRRYRLVRKIIVRPEQVEVVAPTGEARLTLLTCYPFRWIGPAPLRLAWQAEPEVSTAAASASR